MKTVFMNSAAQFSSAAVLVVSLTASMETASIAATATSTARIQVVQSLVYTTLDQTTLKPVSMSKPCEHKFFSFNLGKDSDYTLSSRASLQCTSVYEVSATEGYILVIP